MANGELCISNKQVNRLVRTILWRRVAERALRSTCFGDIPAEVNSPYIADPLRISEAFAAPLANLFAFVKQGHQPCSFIPQKQLVLNANPLFWQVWPVSVCLRVLHFQQPTQTPECRCSKDNTEEAGGVQRERCRCAHLYANCHHVFRARNGARRPDAAHQ